MLTSSCHIDKPLMPIKTELTDSLPVEIETPIIKETIKLNEGK